VVRYLHILNCIEVEWNVAPSVPPVAIWPIVVALCRHCPIVGHMLRWQWQ